MKCETIKYTNHAVEFMARRGISEQDTEMVLQNGEVIEEYPTDKPLPSKLLFLIVDKKPVHLVVGYDEVSKTCFVITAYEPNLEKFEIDFKTSKKK